MASSFDDLTSIVAGIDFSDWTEPVLNAAESLAEAYDASMNVVYAEAFEPPPYFTSRSIDRVKEALALQREEAERALKEAVEATVKGRVPTKATLVERSAAEAILHAADTAEAGAIVLGTHGRTGMHRMMLGSVAEKVLREATAPVMTVRRPDRDGAPCRLPFETVLCPVNFSPVAEDALRLAAGVAERFGAGLKVVTCAERGEMDEERFRSQVEERIEASGHACEWEAAVRKGDAVENILKAAKEWQADLIVIGAQHSPLLETTIFGTTSIRVTRHASCPVLTVPRPA